MFIIDSHGNIEITRGDTGEFKLSPYFNANFQHRGFRGGSMTFQAGDIILFHILTVNAPFEDPIVRGEYTVENETPEITIRINHEDTIELPPYTYYYEVKLIREMPDGSEFYETIVPRKYFIVR